MHERRARRDGIRVPSLFSFRGNLLAHRWNKKSAYSHVLQGNRTHPSTLPLPLNVPRTFHAPPEQNGIVGIVVGSSSLWGRLRLRENKCRTRFRLCRRLANGHEEQFSRSNHVYDPFRVLEYLHHHLFLGLWGGFPFGVRTRVNLYTN